MSQPAEQPAGVIHDIGYRRYEGRRLGRGYARRALFTYSLRELFGLGRPARSKVLPFGFAGLTWLPALIAVAVVAGFGAEPVPFGAYASFLQPVITLFLATQAPVLVTGDVRHSVLPLYFSRPPERRDYVAAKLAALFAGMLIVVVTPLLILYVGELLAGLDVTDRTTRLLPALAGAVVLVVVLSTLGLALTSFTRRRAFGIATIIGYFLVTAGVVGIVRVLLADAGRAEDGQLAGLFAPFNLVDGLQGWAFGVRGTVYPPPEGTTGLAYLAVTLVLVAVSGGAVWWRYRKVQA